MELYQRLIRYVNDGYYPMHMPGHKRNDKFQMENPYFIDITEIDGFDNLHEAEDILFDSMKHTASIFHAKQSFFLVNGSTVGLLAGISAATKKGDSILMARNCHKSVYNAVYLNELKPFYLYPKPEEETGILTGVNPDDVAEMIKEHPKIKLVVITSPTYEGVVSDVETIAKITHNHGIPLIVDEAHGAHFGFHPAFPKNSNTLGADLVIQSIHKTLPAFTQTALLHKNSDRVREADIKKYLSIFQTSSPSYVLMAGMDSCVSYLEDHGEDFEAFVKELAYFYDKAKELKDIRLWEPEKNNEGFVRDHSKLILCSENEQLSGKMLYDILRVQYKIQPEMALRDYILCMTSIGDTKEGFDRLLLALKEIDNKFSLKSRKSNRRKCSTRFTRPEIAFYHYEMDGKETRSCLLEESLHAIAAEFVYLYPPGIPILVPGEVITDEVLEQLLTDKKEGLSLKGMQDKSGNHIFVLK